VSELGAGLIGAAFGAIFAYLLDLRKAARERSHQAKEAAKQHAERRAALATALLIDLRTIESTLRQFYKLEHPSGARGFLPSPFFDRVEHELVIFSASTVARVLAVYTSTRDFFALLSEARSEPVTGDLDWAVRCKAGFALQALPDAVEALVADGGEFPPERKVGHVFRPDLPKVSGRVFPRVLTEDARGFSDEIE
jgi:hypothetical protein